MSNTTQIIKVENEIKYRVVINGIEVAKTSTLMIARSTQATIKKAFTAARIPLEILEEK